MAKIIIAANRLPVSIGKTIKKSSGGLVSALDGIFNNAQMTWIGWPGTYTSGAKTARNLQKTLIDEFNCIPVSLTKNDITNYYHGFSNSCLWPALHYFPHYVHYSADYWDTYVKINQRFAEKIIEHAQNTDMVWIHDYHLFLLPQILREMDPKLKIGFFLHTPFPSYEVFRCVPHRTAILRGLLGADLIGFHTYGYLRHFRSSVIRLLNIESDIDRILFNDRFCRLGVFPIGINSRQFLDELKSSRFQKRKNQLRSFYGKNKIVLSVERVDYTKGILRRLETIEKFLSEQKNNNDVVFVSIGVPTRGEVREYKELLNQIQKRVGEINSQYATIDHTPIKFINHSIPFADLCALYSIADVAMITPLIDGMNLVAKEYLACKTDANGVLLLSEFAGSAHELFNAVQVNPYDINDGVEKLKLCLSMSNNEKEQRLKSMRRHVLKYDAVYWAETFLDELSRGQYPKKKDSPGAQTIKPKIIKQIRSAKKIALFIDYDGTLREFEDLPEKASPALETLDVIASLANDPRYEIFIISGRPRVDLEIWFGALPVTLVADHGYSIFHKTRKEWQTLQQGVDLNWKEKVVKIFSQYVATTPGTFIEEKAASVVWHFRKADPEFGRWKAQQLIGNIMEILSNENLIVNQGNFIIEAISAQINKGSAVRFFMEKNNYNLVVCAGDDKTDETMFKINDPRIISIKIGEGDTFAQYRFQSPRQFREFLMTLSTLKLKGR